jgi:dual specificity protein kinase YAK1
VQEQQRYEGIVKQRQQQQAQQQAQAAQAAQAQAQAQAAQYANMQQMNQYVAQSPHNQTPAVYNNNMYTPNHPNAPPPYPAQQPQYGQQMGMMQPQQARQYNQPQNLYAQATTRAGRQRASTMDQQQAGIPPALQRVISHLDPNAPIRLQPSPAYYPPPPEGAPDSASSARRRGSRAGNQNGRGGRDFIRTLEDRTLEEGFMTQNQW